MFFIHDEVNVVDMMPGVKRRVLAADGSLMVAEFHVDAGVQGPMHTHVAEQVTYVVEGEVDFTIDDEIRKLKKGDSAYTASNQAHKFAANHGDCVLIDVYTPQREEFK